MTNTQNLSEAIIVNVKKDKTDLKGIDTQIGFINAVIDITNYSLNYSINVSNKNLFEENLITVQAQIKEFEASTREKAKEIGIKFYA